MHTFGGPEDATAQALRQELTLLGEQWVRLGAPISDVLAPGISPVEVDALTEPLGLRVPVELKVLWEWHNGSQAEPRGADDYSIGHGGYEFLSVQDALQQYLGNRQSFAEPEEPDLLPQMFWHTSWLPFMMQQAQRLYVDCERTVTGHPGAAPVRLVSWEWEAFDVDVAQSVTAAVLTWTWLLEQNYYRVELQGERRVFRRFSPVPRFLRGGLV